MLVPLLLPVLLAAGLATVIRRVLGEKLLLSRSLPWTIFGLLTAIFLTAEIVVAYLYYAGDVEIDPSLTMGLMSIASQVSFLSCGGLALFLAMRRLDRMRRAA